jgi:hypothetical protein
MLVCNVSLQARRASIAAGLVEAAAAADSPGTGNVVFATLVDDPASVGDSVDAFLGEIMAEAASAADSIDVGFSYGGDIAETASAGSAEDGTVTSAPATTTWNPSDKSASLTLSGGNLVAASNTGGTAGGVRGTRSITSSKAYCEIACTYSGISDNFIGVAPAAKSLTSTGGVGSAWVNVFGGWMYINSNSNSGNIGFFNSGDLLCIALDQVNRRLWFRRNNGTWNNSGTADPATNTGGFDVSALFTSAAAYPIAVFVDINLSNTINAGASAFAQTVPSGFVSWNSAT